MELQAVYKSYARWAPIYDLTFGAVTNTGRKRVASLANAKGGTLLEVGVGTGMSLHHYGQSLRVTGIDASPAMLEKAREKVHAQGYTHIKALEEMDARAMTFADDNFDHVAALHIMSVVPNPDRVLAELARVCKLGGFVYIVNHFANDVGFISLVEKVTAPMHGLLGWHSDFERSVVMASPRLRLLRDENLPPWGLMTLLKFQKIA